MRLSQRDRDKGRKTTQLPFSHCTPENLAIAASSSATTPVSAAANRLPARSAGTISGDPDSFPGSLEFFNALLYLITGEPLSLTFAVISKLTWLVKIKKCFRVVMISGLLGMCKLFRFWSRTEYNPDKVQLCEAR